MYLLDRFVKPEERDDRIFSLIKEITALINKEEEKNFSKIQVYFFWRLIDLLGYRPQLSGCALCGNTTKGQQLFFNITDNIIICRGCAGQGISVQEDTLESLRRIFYLSLDEFLKIDLDYQLVGITSRARQIKLSEL